MPCKSTDFSAAVTAAAKKRFELLMVDEPTIADAAFVAFTVRSDDGILCDSRVTMAMPLGTASAIERGATIFCLARHG